MSNRIVVLNHAHADGEVNGNDLNRRLTDEGRRAAGSLCASLRNPNFGLVICSPCPATQETAMIVAGREHDVTEKLLCGPASEQGRAELLTLWERHGGIDRSWEADPKAWTLYTRDVVRDVTRHVDPEGDRLIVGHAPFICALIHALTDLKRCRRRDLGPCEGVIISAGRVHDISPD